MRETLGQAIANANGGGLVIATVGLPRSGKTTWAKASGFPIVSPDAIRLAMHGQRFASVAEPLVWATAGVCLRAILLAGNPVVVFDSTATTRKRRDAIRDMVRGHRVVFKRIDTLDEVCLRRAENEGDREIVPVIERMAAQFEALGADEAEVT